MTRDMLLFGSTNTAAAAPVFNWFEREVEAGQLHPFVPDWHRLQLERWLWDARPRFGASVIDVGVESPRRWIGAGYRTLGLSGCDVTGSLLCLPFADASIETFLVTEVLEHCEDPWRAVREVARCLAPGGRLFVTSPFVWPWHGTSVYRDFWRFTHEGWALLLQDFVDVTIRACQWTDEGAAAYDVMRRFECFGFEALTHAHTGYLCEAVKP